MDVEEEEALEMGPVPVVEGALEGEEEPVMDVEFESEVLLCTEAALKKPVVEVHSLWSCWSFWHVRPISFRWRRLWLLVCL
jgi:hypothetical protein